MVHFINNIGDYFASNYFDEDFSKKVIAKSGYNTESQKQLEQRIAGLKTAYFKLKKQFVENKLRTKDKINLSHAFHTQLLEALGYDAQHNDYNDLYPIDDKSVLPVRHILYRGAQPYLMVMEMHALIKVNDEEPEGLFEQQYTAENDDQLDADAVRAQKYHRSQWEDIFRVPEGVSVSPMIINKAVSQLFLLPQHRRPKFILMCAGNQYFLLESEKWFRGSYLQLDLEALFDDAAINKNYYAVFYLLLAKDLLAPTAEMVLLDQLDEDAHKAAYEVTKDLKEGVIHAVERLANETVFYLRGQGVSYADIDATKLKDDCLNMVYRLLFLFYAESREDLDILPSNDEIYNRGYSLEMLRDLEQVPLVTESSKNGYYFHKSLYQLFDLLSSGYRENEGQGRSFKIRHLDSPMFEANELHYLGNVQIRNHVWQDVICELSLSKKQKGKSRGRISYANLGINQLGSVYESLLAFRGFLAETDYIEVHRKRKKGETSEKVVRTDGSYLVPRHRLGDFDDGEVYKDMKADGSEELKIIPEGTFIYRLSGRDRQKSASYYTPEVLTQTTVKYTLKPILQRLEDNEIGALDLLKLKILEPAMGAAAFHNEVINQLAEAYITYRQQELKRRVEPDKFQEELQKIKAYIALNNVYGVDLNPTAIELGKLSLWLNVIHKDMHTPFFGYRLGVGNAVVGSWLKVFKYKDFSFEPKGKGYVKKEWWNTAPRHLKFGKKGVLRREEEIYHFLLPDTGMASSAGIKLLKEAYPDEARRVTEWRKEFCSPIRAHEYQQLQKISRAIDALLLEHYEIQKSIGLITESNPQYFGNSNPETSINFDYSYDQKEKFAEQRLKPNAPYYKLKQIMDYWCSLWFWDVRHAKDLPTRREWYEDLVQILNIDLSATEMPQSENEEDTVRDYRKDKKQLEKLLAEALKQSTYSLFENERSALIKKYADQYRFFHYELEFIEVFRENNGFDIAVGNPPWVGIEFSYKKSLGERFPELNIRDYSDLEIQEMFYKEIISESYKKIVFEEAIDIQSLKSFMCSNVIYDLVEGRSNLYKNILINALKLSSPKGYIGLIHPEKYLFENLTQKTREFLYNKLLYFFQFQNELKLFSEVGNAQTYSINIYSGGKENPSFTSMFNLFHPSTVDGSFIHSGLGEELSMKIPDEFGKFKWNIYPHRNRIIEYDLKTLLLIGQVFQEEYNWNLVKPINLFSNFTLNILKKIDKINKVNPKHFYFTTCYNEATAPREGIILRNTGFHSLEDENFCISGPLFYVSNPFYQTPKEICDTHRAYEIIDLNKIEKDFLPRTNYVVLDKKLFDNNLQWYDRYKTLFPKMQNNPGERTLQASLFPPKTTHIDSVVSIVFLDDIDTIKFCGLSSSIPYDFLIKIIGKKNFRKDVIEMLPFPNINSTSLVSRTLLLNCINLNYAALWEENYQATFNRDSWSIQDPRLKPFSSLTKDWTWSTPLRNYFERRMALVEIDVITAMALNLTLDELILMYNIQFPVLQQNEDDTWYDTRGNIVFTCSKGLTGVGLDRPDWEKIKDLPAGETYEHTITKSELYYGEKVIYYAPFTKCDRVEDYKRAWAHFEKRFKEA